MQLKRYRQPALLATLFFVCGMASAQSPSAMLQGVANRMTAKLERHQAELKKNPALIKKIVNTVLVPNISINRMAGMVVGRKNWYAASPAMRRQFVHEFKNVVINTYSNALASYNGDKVKVFPVRTGVNGRRFIRVKSLLIRRSGQKIPISYNLVNDAGRWKVYDFSIEGVSIVQNYRSQFSNTLASGGIKLLLTKLSQHTRGG